MERITWVIFSLLLLGSSRLECVLFRLLLPNLVLVEAHCILIKLTECLLDAGSLVATESIQTQPLLHASLLGEPFQALPSWLCLNISVALDFV